VRRDDHAESSLALISEAWRSLALSAAVSSIAEFASPPVTTKSVVAGTCLSANPLTAILLAKLSSLRSNLKSRQSWRDSNPGFP